MDEPTSMAEGTVLNLVVDDEGDELDDAERARLEAFLIDSDRQSREGRVVPVEKALARVRRRKR